MNKASPVVLRDAINAGQTLAKCGIDFVCIPVTSEEHKIKLIIEANSIIEAMAQDAESKQL